ncbi:MAG: uridine kinase [Ruminococcaceae bacterium]|nr:uridine kinase [Oscillospiraceae bacterium]
MNTGTPMIIGIAGGSGSGKTTLCENIITHFGDAIAVLRHDDYYKAHPNLPYSERAKLNYDHPHAFDNDLLVAHMDLLKAGKTIECPTYDYTVHNRSNVTRRVESRPVILLEGILIFEHQALRDRLDMKIFVDTDADVRILRRLLRDVKERDRTLDSVVSQYLTTVKPMHEAFVEPSKKYADIIVPEGGMNPVAFGMIISEISNHLTITHL